MGQGMIKEGGSSIDDSQPEVQNSPPSSSSAAGTEEASHINGAPGPLTDFREFWNKHLKQR